MLMNFCETERGRSPRRREYYTGVLDCVQKICRDEGPRGRVTLGTMGIK